ncbi:pyridoxamine 5'-phosphate oxidase family protein [Halobaculum rubrum]|uniref:pyridoxamine 5'-phosphate oxidase family protein n=1 Tax=Halobaculum rubrum TaxID=2872158 RepID=UPI001CA4410F|nr:pyridoxamine 5'-phosphate oxidase family protein [Halobaculum rubrum]QZX99151.1 pyridoxamine 5'-phosphate oxidase family protein [Halobaculum rubrum]
MDANRGRSPDLDAVGPTLYRESDRLDPTKVFCTEVFEGAEEDTYRVVQLTTTQSFDTLYDAFDERLAEVDDPSEAAVIIMSPHAEGESTVSEVGEDVPLYGFWVDPQDLTGISVAFSRLIERWEDTPGETKICLRNIESLLPYHDTDLVYRFLNTVLATLQGEGADVHAHLRPAALEDKTFQLLSSLFARVVDPSDPNTTDGSDPDSIEPLATSPTTQPENDSDAVAEPHGDEGTVEMSDTEIDEFLESTGHGVLALAGEQPYAIPVSYGYDLETGTCYLQLSRFNESEKHRRLDASANVSLVVVEYARPDQWKSVIVDGSLTKVSSDAVDEGTMLDAYAESNLASIDVFSRDLSDISFEWYVLDPTEFSGRQSPTGQ